MLGLQSKAFTRHGRLRPGIVPNTEEEKNASKYQGRSSNNKFNGVHQCAVSGGQLPCFAQLMLRTTHPTPERSRATKSNNLTLAALAYVETFHGPVHSQQSTAPWASKPSETRPLVSRWCAPRPGSSASKGCLRVLRSLMVQG